MSIRHFIDENNKAYDVPENEVDEFMQSVSASGVKVTEEQQKNNKIRIFSDNNGKRYDVPENEVDEFMQSASSSGANVKEINLDNQEKRSFRDEEGKIYDVPANEIDEFMQSVKDSGKNVNEIKSLGIFGTIKKNQEAQFGEMSTGELLYSMIPIIGKAEQTRQEMNERALFNGEFNDTLEGGKIAAAAGIPQDQIDKIYEETGSGGRNRFGGWNTHDMVEFKKRMKALAEPLIKKRIQTRQAAQQDLQNNDLNLAQRIVTGLAGATELAPMMNTGAAIATLPADAIVRGARMSMPELTVDDNGEIVEVTKGDSDSAAIAKGAVGSAVERFIWMGLGKVLKAGGAKLLEKSTGLDNALGYVAGKPLQWSAAVGKKLSESEGGRLLLKTADVLGKVEDKIHLGSLPEMMMKSRLTELSNEVVGLNLSNDQQGEEFTKWLGKFVSVKDNLDLMVDLIGIHALMGGYSALKARSLQKSFREDAGKILGEYLSNEQIQKLSNEDISMLTRMVTSKGLTAERAEKFLDDARADLAEAEEKVSSGRKLSEIQDGLETIKKGSQQAIDEGQKIVDKMKSDEQRAAESVELERQEAIKAAEAEQAAAEATKEAERIDQSNFRGASTEEQLASLDEREVNSWEDAAAKNLIHQDDQGRWTGGARQAINIHLNGTEKMKSAVKEGRLDGDLAEELLSTSYCELGDKPKVERDALIDSIIDQSDGNPDTARKLLSELTGSYATMDRQPQTALEGAENAARMKGTELRSVEGPMMGCERFPEVKVTVNSEGIFTEGLTDKLMSDPRNAADVAALLTRLSSISEKTGLPVNFAGDENAAKVANDIASAVHEQGLAKIQRKMDTRAKLFDVLAQTTLDKGTTFTEAEFKKALAETSNGHRYVDNHGNIYGFKSADGTLHFNPAAINFNTPIHEYGHLALEAVKKINPTLWKKGMELIKKHEYFDNIKKMSDDPEHEYSYLKGKEEDIADEALTTLIGDRGERIVENTGLGAELKSWLKEFWNAFKNAFGVADLTEQQIENMTIGDFVDAINAELLRGKEFGTKKQRPLEKKSIRRYDEDQNSGSNGILRWKNDRGYLFAIPVDMERTQPGGKVVFATDDANITDWIQNRLNGYTLRLSKNGKIYVEGRDGLPSDLSDIFGRYPRIGNNDGIYNDAASSIGRADYADGTMTPERLVEMLAKDRENYIAWNEQRNSEQNHYEMEALRDAEEAKRRWEDSGMSVIDYIRSRAEEGVPEFDLDWETAREIANDRNNGSFQVKMQARNKPLSELARSKVGEWIAGTSSGGIRRHVAARISEGFRTGEYRFKSESDRKNIISQSVKFYNQFSRKTVMLSDGRVVYFAPDPRARKRGLTNEEAWAEYAIHAVTSSGKKLDGKDYRERLFNVTKANSMSRIDKVLKDELCSLENANDRDARIAFYGRDSSGKTMKIVARFDDSGNIYADLSEITILTGINENKIPPPKPLEEVVRQAWERGVVPAADDGIIPDNNNTDNTHTKLSAKRSFTSIEQPERVKDLIATHNESEDTLASQDELGGLAMPSIAVTKDSYPHTEFGNISLIFKSDSIDPKKNRSNALYSHDAWTPSFPQVFNKVDFKSVTDSVSRLIKTLPKEIADLYRGKLYRLTYEDGISDAFNSASNAADAFAGERIIKAAYLASKGESVEPVLKDKTYIRGNHMRVSGIGTDGVKKIFDKLGKRLIDAYDGPGAKKQNAYDSLSGELAEVLRDIIWERDYKNDPEVIKGGFGKEETVCNFFKDKPLTWAEIEEIAEGISRYSQDLANGSAERKTVDEYATDRMLDDKVDSNDEEYRSWVNKQFGNPILAKGVYNGKDRYTKSGNRRGWDQLHDPLTLENVVRSMLKTQSEQGSGFIGRNPFGVAARKFSTLKDLINNEGILRQLSREEEQKIKQSLSNRLNDLIIEYMKSNKSPDRNEFIEHSRAADMVFDAWEAAKGSIDVLKKELNGWGYSANDKLVKQLMTVYNDIALMSTNYFEAKPKRSVGFEEVAAAVIPSDVSDKTREILNRRGIMTVEYKAGDENDRLRAVNEAANITEAKFATGDAPRINGRNFIAGRAMTAEDYGRGEQTPGAMAAARELDQTHAAPISMYGKIRKMSLPLSELEQLRKMITGNKIPAQLVKRMPGGVSSSHDRSGQIFIAADILGMVDKTDAASQKELLKQHGFFLNEDPTWTSAHTPTEIRNEKRRSEDQLADQLIRLSNERANGTKSGGFGAVRQVFADELAAMIMDMPRQTPSSVLGTVQKIGRGLRAELKDLITAAGTASGDVENAMRGEAEPFLDWAYGNRGNRPDGQPISSYTINELSAKMFGAWLVMPLEVENRAPQWSKAIETTIANTPKLADAFRELTVRSMSEQATAHLEYRIRKQQSIQTEQVISKLRSEREDPIGTGSKKTDAIEGLMVAFHDKMSPVYLRIDEKVKQYIQAKREILKNTTDPAVKASVQQQIDAFMGNIGDKLHKLELSRTAYERGSWNEGRRYFIQMVNLENKASAKWGLAEEDRSLYLDLQRIIETQGRSASDGISPQQASIMLGDMARKLGTDKWDLMRQYGDEFFAIHEREILNDSRLERMLGKGVVDYFRTQSHYVTTKRTWSEDDLAAIEIARKDARNKGVAGGDDIVSQMYQYAGRKGAGELIGESLWNAKLKGSMAAKQEVRSATWEKIDPLMASVRRNQQILDLRDALLAADVTGVRDLPRTEGSKYPDSRRYGHINYMENGNKRVLVVPKQISDAFKTQPDNAAFITKVNGLVRKAFIDWNIAYTPQNVKRNQASLEMNMPGMRETYLKTALRATVPGAAPLVDLATQFLVRKFPALGNMFGKHTVFFHLPKAERWAKIVEDPTAWQRQLWDAEQRGDVAEIQRLNDDYYGVMEMLKGNFLVPAGKAYSNEPTTFGFAFDAMARKGLKTLEMIERETNSKTKLAKFVDAINIFKKNQAQNEHEDVLAKTIGYLHDRMFYSMQRNQVESGLAVKRNVSIAEGERAGKLKRGIQQTVAQFYNMCEKGITRHWRNFSERPGEMIARDAKVWIGRAIGSLIAYGALQKFLLDDSDGDEQKAKEKYGKIYDYAAFCHRAYQNCSQYVKDNYNFTPVWTSDDGMTSLIMGGALTDEDKLIVPTADLFSKWIAYNQGIGERPDFGPAIANSTFKAITPDLQLASPALTLVRDTVEAMFVDNPTDYFRNAPTYDEDLYRARNESWEMRGKFAAAMAARVWNDLGGRGLVQPDVNGVDNGRGNAPESIESILRKIPVMSPALGRLFKIQVGSPEKLGQPIANEKKTTQAIINVCAKSLFNSRNEDQYLHEFDPAEYERRISRWSEVYDLTPLETAKLRAKYLNAVNQHRNRSAYDLKKLMQLRKEARKQGRDEADIWIMLGEM